MFRLPSDASHAVRVEQSERGGFCGLRLLLFDRCQGVECSQSANNIACKFYFFCLFFFDILC